MALQTITNPELMLHSHIASFAASFSFILGHKLTSDPVKNCPADVHLTSCEVCWSLAITERLSPMSDHRKHVNYSGEEKVAILRDHFVEGLLQEHVQRKKPMGPPGSTLGPPRHPWSDRRLHPSLDREK